ncbi:MAG TPA: FAD-dependent oxidoreductase [Armatimonadota bacterium]
MKQKQCDILVAGGSMGGVAAALCAAKLGKRVILTEETDWLGGQLTSQAVCCPDENRYIEHFGCTETYRALRDGIRNYYRKHYPLRTEVAANPFFSPGNGWVSRLCQEPRVGLAVIDELLAPYTSSGRIEILYRHKPVRAETDGDFISGVEFESLASGDTVYITAPYVIDATELGDVLPLSGTEYVSGAESRTDTGEPHAVDGPAQPDNVQSFTYCFLADYLEGEDWTIAKPEGYEAFRDAAPFAWTQEDPHTLKPRPFGMFDRGLPWSEEIPLWTYRRVVDAAQFAEGAFAGDVSLINWPMNDYIGGNIIDKPDDVVAKHLDAAKRQSLSLLYWLQTEAPRQEGGAGYPGVRLRADAVGTEDGLAKYPYIREARRIVPLFRVLEQHISPEGNDSPLAEPFEDSVGIGLYRIDLHPSAGGYNYIDIGCRPYQIPLGALIPVRVRNLMAACKNIGTTHITNGAYRLHPVEWNCGESAGALAVFCMDHQTEPHAVYEDKALLKEFQQGLEGLGVPLEWPIMQPA